MSIQKNLSYTLALSVTQLVIPLITMPYVSRVLLPSDIGLVSFIDAYTYFFTILAEFGIISYAVRSLAKVKDDPSAVSRLSGELLSIQLITSAIAFLVFLGGLLLVWNKIGNVYLALCSIGFFLANFFYCEWYYWGTEQFRYITLRSLLIRITGTVAIFLFVRQPGDVVPYYAIMTANLVATLLINYFYLIRKQRIRFSFSNWSAHFSHLLLFNGITLFYAVFQFTDVPLLRLAHSAHAAGVYALAVKIVRMPTTVITDLLWVLFPQTVHLLGRSDRNATSVQLQQSLQLLLFLSIPLATGIYLIRHLLTGVYLGKEFSGVADDLAILSLLALIMPLELYFQRQVMIAFQQEKYLVRILGISSILFIAACVFLSSFFADLGTCWALVLSELLLVILYLFRIPKIDVVMVGPQWSFLLQVISGCVLFIPVYWGFSQALIPDPWKLAGCVVMCVIVYFFWMVSIVKNKVGLQIWTFLHHQFVSR